MTSATEQILIRPVSTSEMDQVIAIDDDACALFEQAGLRFDIGPTHPFARSEWARWTQAATEGNAFFAEWPGVGAVGMLVMGRIDGAPYLDQLSVRTKAMRRGIGRRLVSHAIEWAEGQELWLTTYAHLPWNKPFYEQAQFSVVPEPACPAGIVATLVEQRRWLPAPGERIAMRRPGVA